MAFNMVYSLLFATGIAIGLTSLAIHNRSTGWRRQRRDNMMDVLMLWAEMQAAEREEPGTAPEVVTVPDRGFAIAPARPAVTDLIALHNALGASIVVKKQDPKSHGQRSARRKF